MDAARWIVPEQIGDADSLTLGSVGRLLWLHPGLRAMLWFRVACMAKALGIRGLPLVIQHRLLRSYGLELIPGEGVGGGLYIAHPVGCTLVAEGIGANVTVIGAVTFGYKRGHGWPEIGDRAYFGVGARVLGPIRIGDGAIVGANAVVNADVEPGATVVGVPARPIRAQRQLGS